MVTASKVNVVNIKYLSPNIPFNKIKIKCSPSPEGIHRSKSSAILKEAATNTKAEPTASPISCNETSLRFQKDFAKFSPLLLSVFSNTSICGVGYLFLKKLKVGIKI